MAEQLSEPKSDSTAHTPNLYGDDWKKLPFCSLKLNATYKDRG